ncbi:E3 ubiquitin-protein ligase SHPRH-like isoform X2 [Lytechinus pictus]
MREKRKPTTSQRLDAEKRQCLSWDMYSAADTASTEGQPSTSQVDEGIDPDMVFGVMSDVGLRLVGDGTYEVPDQSSGVDLCPISDVSLHLGEDSPKNASDPVSDEEVIDLTGVKDVPFLTEEVVCTEPEDVQYQFRVSRSKYDILEEEAAYSIKIHLDQPEEKNQKGLLCTMKVKLSPVSPAFIPQPNPQLPKDGYSTLLLRDAPGLDFLVFHDEQTKNLPICKFSKKDRLLGRGSFLAFAVEMDRRPSSPCLESFQELVKVKKGMLQLCIHDHDPASGCAVLDAWILSGIVSQPSFASQCPSKKRHLEYVPQLMNWYHGYPPPTNKKGKVHKRYDYNTLFDKVRQYHETQEVVEVIDVQHSILVPVLRPYQRDAVRWMVQRETMTQNDKGQLHILWRLFKTVDDRTLYYNPQSGEITDQMQEMPEDFPGGILADEMGLGKTVEVLALILANPRWAKDFSRGTAASSGLQDNPDGNHLSSEHSNNDNTSSSMQDNLPECASRVEDIPQGNDLSEEHSINNNAISSKQDKSPETASNVEDVVNSRTEGTLTSSEIVDIPDVPSTSSSMQDKLSESVGTGHSSVEGSSDHRTAGTLISSGKIANPNVQEDVALAVPNEQDVNGTDGETLEGSTVLGDDVSSFPINKMDVRHTAAEEATETHPSQESSELTGSNPNKGEHTQNVENSESQRPGEMMPSVIIDGVETRILALKVESEFESDIDLCNSMINQQPQENNPFSEPNVQYASQAVNHGNSTTQNAIGVDSSMHLQGEEGMSLTVIKEEQDNSSSVEMHEQLESPMEDVKEPISESENPKVFECICGRYEQFIRLPACVQCLRCHSWLHAACIGFDIHMRDKPSHDLQFWCPNCFPKVPPLESAATLIISPASISYQWVDEINRHIDSSTLKVMMYEGVKKEGYIQPQTLANCDIVITTYSTLRTELDYANLSQPGAEGRSLRKAKRYQTTPSPLPCIEWWRICLDEAQMIEYTTAKSAEMANRLSARNRWCVTGTPIQKSLDDLYGLFLFLGIEPYWVKHWWDVLLSIPYSNGHREPLQKALCKIFWRSAKKDVLDQIALPPQREEIHWLDFSPVEKYFYKTKHEECSVHFTFNSDKASIGPETKLSTLDRRSLQSLLGPLLRVRQACCHPRIVRGEFTALQKKKQLSMQDLLKTMITKAEIDSDGAHRQLVCAMNALAAVHCIKEELPEAASLYREVLKSAEEHKDKIKTDKLQILHATYNLDKIIKDRPEVVQPSPADGNLARRMVSLRNQYLQKTAHLVSGSLQTVQPIRDKVVEQQEKLPGGPAWYLDGIQWAIYQGLGAELVKRIKTELEAKSEVMGLANRFRDARGLQFILTNELEELAQLYESAWDGVASLQDRLQDKALLAEATDCHLRPFKGKAKNTCPFCKVQDHLQRYEMKLFSFDVRNLEAVGLAGPSNADPNQDDFNMMAGGPRGNWAISEHERALRILHSFLKSCSADDLTLEEGTIFLDMLEQQRKEFKPLRAYWGAMRDRVAAMDELEMAMLRLRVKLPGEETDPASQPYIIEPLEVEQQRYRFLNDRMVAKNDLKRKLGQLLYLQNLDKAQYNLKDGHNPEVCPICVRPLGGQWTVLQCGHCFCTECMETMLMRVHIAGRQGSVKCAVCRLPTEGTDVSYVSVTLQAGSSEAAEERVVEESIKVEGDHSTKIEAVVRTLKKIQMMEPGAKAIVFSTWSEVLELISKALTQNWINFKNAAKNGGQKYFHAALTDFKHDPDITVLLLPVHSGSKGLNLIEATHVLLVEPILNPASELQAIGRVHRIGQTKPTVVHRFLIHETIEEKLHTYLSTHTIRDGLNSVETDTGDMTFSDLKGLFSSET